MMRRWIALLALLAAALPVQIGMAADLSNPLKLMFVADAEENFIDVVDLDSREAVERIETK